MHVDVKHDKNGQQFTAEVEGKTGVLRYSIADDGKTLDYESTFVPQELRGKHIGEEIVKYALNYAKENNYKVIPSCPFVKSIIKRHPEYNDLI